MKKILMLLFGMFVFSIGYSQASDTTITSRVTYHFKLADGTIVDSVVEKTYTVEPKQKMVGVRYAEPVRTPYPGNPVYTIRNPVQNGWNTSGNYSQYSPEPTRSDWNGFGNCFQNRQELTNPDEVFIGNIEKKSISTYKKKYKTLRTGKVAYSRGGTVLPEYVPAFVKSEEYYEKN